MGAFYCQHCDRTLDSQTHEAQPDPLDPGFFWCIECQTGQRVCYGHEPHFCVGTYKGRDDFGQHVYECMYCGEDMGEPE